MKRGSITGLGLLTSALLAYGQGQVIFVNTSSTLITTNAAPGAAASGPISDPAGSYYFALFVAPPGTVDTSTFTFAGAYGTNTTLGRFNGDQPSISGYPPGSTVALLVRGWSATIGTDLIAVSKYLSNPTFTAHYGESQIANLILGSGTLPVPSLFGTFQGTGLNQIPGFNLDMYSIPEPSSCVLAIFASGALLVFRSRVVERALLVGRL